MSESAELPPEFDPDRIGWTGIEVLDNGLPALPDVLTYQMSIPVAYWKANGCAVVLFLYFRHWGDEVMPMVMLGTFSREGEGWSAHQHWYGTGWSHDPIKHPDDLRDLGGETIASGGGSWPSSPASGDPAGVVTGRAGPSVKQIALIQHGKEDRRTLQSHFGAWVVCIEHPSPYRIAALDENGIVLGYIDGPWQDQ